MRLKKIKTITYHYGEEKKLQQLLFKLNEPLLIRIKGFPDTFSIDYFIKKYDGMTPYSVFDRFRHVEEKSGHLDDVLNAIKDNNPYRIFGQYYTNEQSSFIEKHVPLWQSIPFRPRFYAPSLKVAYFFGGPGSATKIHFDREHCCNLHLCLSGKKQVLLFTKDQSDYIYKVPYIGDSLIDFSKPMAELHKKYPRLKDAAAYQVTLLQGDMIFMPRNCWHYTRYIEPSASATYVFYPHKFWQFYGFFTGYFFIGYKWRATSLKISDWTVFKIFSFMYARSSGWKKFLLKIIEKISYFFLLPLVSIGAIIACKIKEYRARKIAT